MTWRAAPLPLTRFFIAAALLLTQLAAPAAAERLLIRNATLLSAERERPLPGASVRIRDGQIVAVSDGELTAADDEQLIDAAGLFLLPGLTDSHLHLTVIPGLGFSGYGHAAANPELVAAYERQLPRSLLYFGVTQLLDPAPAADALARFQAAPLRPDVFTCGAAPVAGGYPLMFLAGGPRDDDFRYGSGYVSSSQFSREFKRLYGQSHRQWSHSAQLPAGNS